MRVILNKFLFVCAVCAMLPLSVFSQDIDSEQNDYDSLFDQMTSPGDTDAQSEKRIRVSAQHESALPLYTKDMKYAYADSSLSVLSHRFVTDAVFDNVSARASIDAAQRFDGGQNRDFAEYSIYEAYLDYRCEGFTFRGGRQIFHWGSADTINPTDWINPRDTRNPYDVRKIPAAALSLYLYPSGSVIIEALYLPVKARSRPRISENESVPEEMFAYMVSGYDMNQQQLNYSHWKRVYYENDSMSPGAGAGALRLRYVSPRFDSALSFGYDRDPFYTPELTMVMQSAEEAGQSAYMVEKMKLRRLKLYRAGFDFKTVLERYTLWFETCASFYSEDPGASYMRRGGEIVSTAGVDTPYGNENRGYVNLQYNLRYLPGFDASFYRDYTDGRPDMSRTSDKDYMERYYYRALVQNMGNYHSRYLHTVVLHNEYKLIENLLSVKTDTGFQLPVSYSAENAVRIGTVFGSLCVRFSPRDSLIFSAGVHQAFPLKKPGGSDSLHIDHQAEMIEAYECAYIFAAAEYGWNADI